MLLPLLPLRAATLAFTGWLAATPGPRGDQARAEISAAVAAAPDTVLTIELYDVNHNEYATIHLGLDGSLDPTSEATVKHLLRCKRTERQHKISTNTLAMFASVAAKWPGHTIDIISGYRAMKKEPSKSFHRKARAIDFHVRGVPITAVRDYLWRTFRHVGVGYYPEHQFLHLDYRPEVHDTAWTFRHGHERYRPHWAEHIRPAFEDPPRPEHRGKHDRKHDGKHRRHHRPHASPRHHAAGV